MPKGGGRTKKGTISNKLRKGEWKNFFESMEKAAASMDLAKIKKAISYIFHSGLDSRLVYS